MATVTLTYRKDTDDFGKKYYTVTGYTADVAQDKTEVVIPATHANTPSLIDPDPLSYPVKKIKDELFKAKSDITKVTIGINVDTIGAGNFAYCSNLTEITVNSNNENYKSIDGNLYSKNGATLIQYAIGKAATSFEVPSNNPRVTSIHSNAFGGSTYLKEIILPSTVETISDYAFSGCTALETINLPDSITAISQGVFSGCTALEHIALPSKITAIDQSTFSGCTSLKSILIPEKVGSIGNNAFSGCTALTSVIFLPTTAPTLGSDVFPNNNYQILVTVSAFSQYKAAWTSYEARIQILPVVDLAGLSTYTDKFKVYIRKHYILNDRASKAELENILNS